MHHDFLSERDRILDFKNEDFGFEFPNGEHRVLRVAQKSRIVKIRPIKVDRQLNRDLSDLTAVYEICWFLLILNRFDIAFNAPGHYNELVPFFQDATLNLDTQALSLHSAKSILLIHIKIVNAGSHWSLQRPRFCVKFIYNLYKASWLLIGFIFTLLIVVPFIEFIRLTDSRNQIDSLEAADGDEGDLICPVVDLLQVFHEIITDIVIALLTPVHRIEFIDSDHELVDAYSFG